MSKINSTRARQLLEEYEDLGMQMPDSGIESGVSSLLSQMGRANSSPGIEFVDAMVDKEDGCTCVELLAGGKTVTLYFYMDNDIPLMGVDWDNDDDIDAEFDLAELNPKIADGMPDVYNLSAWMPNDVLQSIVMNPPPESETDEEISLDDWERSGSGDVGGPVTAGEAVTESKKTPRFKRKKK